MRRGKKKRTWIKFCNFFFRVTLLYIQTIWAHIILIHSYIIYIKYRFWHSRISLNVCLSHKYLRRRHDKNDQWVKIEKAYKTCSNSYHFWLFFFSTHSHKFIPRSSPINFSTLHSIIFSWSSDFNSFSAEYVGCKLNCCICDKKYEGIKSLSAH